MLLILCSISKVKLPVAGRDLCELTTQGGHYEWINVMCRMKFSNVLLEAGEIAILTLPLASLLYLTMILHKSVLWKDNWISNPICSKLT